MTRSPSVDVAVRAQAATGEGPVWDGDRGVLRWVDIPPGTVHRSDLESGRDEAVTYGAAVSALALTPGGDLVVAMEQGYARIGEQGLTDVQAVLPPGFRMNDAKCDPAGRFLAGGLRTDFADGHGTLWSWSAGDPPRRLLAGLAQPNGLGWSPDGTVLYFCDTVRRTITAYEYALGTGDPGAARTLLTFAAEDGEADGLCVDADGCLWVAFWGGGQVRRHDPEGKLVARVPLPVSQPSCPAFAGGTRMVVTSARAGLSAAALAQEPLAGSVFCFDAGVTGVPVARFG